MINRFGSHGDVQSRPITVNYHKSGLTLQQRPGLGSWSHPRRINFMNASTTYQLQHTCPPEDGVCL